MALGDVTRLPGLALGGTAPPRYVRPGLAPGGTAPLRYLPQVPPWHVCFGRENAFFENAFFENAFFENFANCWRACSRLYQNEILQENMRLTAFL